MSANKKRRSSIIIIHNNNNDMKSSHQLQQQQQQQMAEQTDMPSVCDMTQARREEEEGDGVEIQKNRMLKMPRVCRCCCKGDMELLSLFEAAGDELINSSSTTKKSQRRRNNLATTSNVQQNEEQQRQQRKSVNPVEYALSGAHSSMDTVREEMIIWMLNVSTLLFSLTLKQQCPNACSTYICMYIYICIYLSIVLPSRHPCVCLRENRFIDIPALCS